MATLMAEYRICILSMFFLMLFFLWMDISLYYKVQGIKPHELYSENVVKNENLDSKHNPLIISRPEGPEILRDGGSITPTVKHGELFSPFKGLSVKMMMMDQTNNYVFTPLAEIFCDMTDFTYNFPSITPNLISFVGILWAFLAGKLVTYDSIAIHRLSVLFFQFRTFCDALDGIVARAHLGITHHVSLSNTPGYIVDGIADSIGFGAYLIGCYIFLRRTLHKHRYTSPQYLPLQHFHEGDKISQSSFVIAQYMPSKLIWTSRQVFFVVTCFALQLAISCVFWNRYIEAYHKLLENPPATQAQLGFQNAVLKSSIMWVIMWFWRISNAQSLMQMLLISVYVNRLWSFLTWIQYIGFIELLTLSFFTEAHLNHVKSIRPLG